MCRVCGVKGSPGSRFVLLSLGSDGPDFDWEAGIFRTVHSETAAVL